MGEGRTPRRSSWLASFDGYRANRLSPRGDAARREGGRSVGGCGSVFLEQSPVTRGFSAAGQTVGMTALLGVLVVVALLCLVAMMGSAQATLALGLMLIGLGLTWIQVGPPGAWAPAGVALVVVALLKGRERQAKRLEVIAVLPLAVGVFALMQGLVQSAPDEALADALATIIMGLCVAASARWLGSTLVLNATFLAVGFWVSASAVSIAAGVTDAFETGRARGLFENANGLGPAAVLLAFLALQRPSRTRILTLVLAGWVILATGSRTSFAAYAVVLVVAAWGSAKSRFPGKPALLLWRTWLVVLTSVAVWSALRASVESSSEVGVLRSGDAGRWDLAQQGWGLFLSRPVSGHGWGLTEAQGLSTSLVLPIKWAASLGVGGLVLWAAVVIAFAIYAWRGDSSVRTLVAVAIVYMVGEPWLIAAGSLTSWSFWLVLTQLTQVRTEALSPATRVASGSHRPAARHEYHSATAPYE